MVARRTASVIAAVYLGVASAPYLSHYAHFVASRHETGRSGMPQPSKKLEDVEDHEGLAIQQYDATPDGDVLAVRRRGASRRTRSFGQGWI